MHSLLFCNDHQRSSRAMDWLLPAVRSRSLAMRRSRGLGWRPRATKNKCSALLSNDIWLAVSFLTSPDGSPLAGRCTGSPPLITIDALSMTGAILGDGLADVRLA